MNTAASDVTQEHPPFTEVKTPTNLEEIRAAARAKIAEEEANFKEQGQGKEIHSSLPLIRVNGRHLRDSTSEAIAALRAANDPPEIFLRLGELVRVQADENRRPVIRELTEPRVRFHLSRVANFVHEKKESLIPVSPPRDIVQNVMATPSLPFPPLQGIVEVPVLRRDGSVLATPGYDPATRLYYRPAPGLILPPIPPTPTRKDAAAAAKFFTNELLNDFPFVDISSRTNSLGAFLTPLVRHTLDGLAPAAVNSATKAGTGKTILNEIQGMVTTGSWMAMLAPPLKRDDDAEWSKIITSVLLKGATTVCFDNCDGILQAPSLASVLTAKIYSGRILGKSKTPEIPVNVSFFINGNNVELGGDLPRRCYWIRLDAQMARPWERQGFKHANLKDWVTENRGRLLVALLTMARAWILAGCPKPTTPRLGSFESWCDSVGGILEFAGMEGFLGNQAEMYELSNVEEKEWEGFLLAWQGHYQDRVILVRDMVEEISKDGSALRDSLPSKIADALTRKGGNLSRAIGRSLPKNEGTRFGDSGVHLVRIPGADPRSNANGWKVMKSL